MVRFVESFDQSTSSLSIFILTYSINFISHIIINAWLKVCAHANIGPKERIVRLVVGVIAFILAAGVVLTLCFFDISRWWRLLVFPIFIFSGIALISSQQRTCIKLAAQKKSSHNGKVEDISDQFRNKAIKKRCFVVIGGALVVAILCTGISLLIPEDI